MSTQNVTRPPEQRLPQSIRGRVVAPPPVDIFENDDGFLIVADLPGASAEHIVVRLEEGELTLHAVWSHAAPEAAPLAAEYREADYKRAFQVPDSIDPDRIEAEFKDGVLRVLLPRAESVKPRSVQVRAG